MKVLSSPFATALVVLFCLPSSSAIEIAAKNKKDAGQQEQEIIGPLFNTNFFTEPKHPITSNLRRGLSYIHDGQSYIAATTAAAASSFESSMRRIAPPSSLFQKDSSAKLVPSSATKRSHWDADFFEKVINVISGKDSNPNTNTGTGTGSVMVSSTTDISDSSDSTLSQSTKVRQKLLLAWIGMEWIVLYCVVLYSLIFTPILFFFN